MAVPYIGLNRGILGNKYSPAASCRAQWSAHELLHTDHDGYPDSEEFSLTSEDEEGEHAGGRFSRLAAWNGFVLGVIVLNTVVVALEACLMSYDTAMSIFNVLEILFTGIYVIEIVFRLMQDGVRVFFLGADKGWNWFDFLVTAAGVLDVLANHAKTNGFSAGRIFRIMRIFRLFRVFKFVEELEYVLVTAARATGKLAVIVLSVVMVFGIVATNLLSDAKNEHIAKQYANLGASMWTMFKLMTLENWEIHVEEVVEDDPSVLPFYIIYIFVAAIALMSLVPAIFIELNLNDREKQQARKAAHQQERSTRQLRKDMELLFRQVDKDRDEKVDYDEMADMLRPNSVDYEDLGLDHRQFRDLKFGLLHACLMKEEEKQERHDSSPLKLTRKEFLDGACMSLATVDDRFLWRTMVQLQAQVRQLRAFMLEQEDRRNAQMQTLMTLVTGTAAPARAAPGPPKVLCPSATLLTPVRLESDPAASSTGVPSVRATPRLMQRETRASGEGQLPPSVPLNFSPGGR